MAIDPAKFSMMAVADTCSVWNVLSSRKFYQASINANVHFCITPMVLYECLYKPRAAISTEHQEMINRLKSARTQGKFPVQACDLDELARLVQTAPKGLGSGELSCIAMAYQIRSLAFMTDEKKARKFASDSLGLNVETTPKLYAWLHFHSHLSDGDHDHVIREHEVYEKRPLSVFLREAFEEAVRCRLMHRGPVLPT